MHDERIGQQDRTQQAPDSARTDKQVREASGPGSVWLRPRQVTPRQTAPLSRERIVSEAVALLDRDGTGRLTMRHLAERLGAGPTTLYWHVDTKDDVLDLALDAIFGEVPLPPPVSSQHWREPLTTFLDQWRTVLIEHPWSAPLLGARPLLGPNALVRSEFLHTTLLVAGIARAHLTAAAYALSNYVIGSAATRCAWNAHGNETETRRAAHEHLRAQHTSYPVQAEHLTMTDQDWDSSFAHGLTYLMDGLATDLQSSAGQRRGAPD